MTLNLILRDHIPKLSGQRQHDALCTLLLVFGYNARFHSTLTLSVDLYGSLSTVVRDGHPLNHKSCPSLHPGVGWLEGNIIKYNEIKIWKF